MKNIKKILSFVMVAFMMITMTSCGNKKVTLTKAFENAAKIKSFKFKSDLSIGLDSPDMPAEAKTILEDLDISIDGVAKRDSIKDAQLKADISFTFQGVSMTLESFYDLAFNDEDDFKYNLFIEIPEILKNDPMLGQLFLGKKYAFLGLDKKTILEKANLTESELEENSFDKESMEKYSENVNKFLKDYYEKNKDSFTTYVEEKEFQLNGETVTLPSYEIALDNDSVRALFKAYFENDKNINDLIELVNDIAPESIDKDDVANELNDMVEDIKNMPNFISEKGINLTFGIQDGHIVKSIYDINLDIEGTKISYTLNQDIFDIDEPVEIEFPDQNGEDVLNLLDLATMFGM